jgi:hypothetical protein
MVQPQILDTPPPVKPLVPSMRPVHTGAAPKAGTRRAGMAVVPQEPPSIPERAIFLAVIERAMNDALGIALSASRPRDVARIRGEAVQWFTEAGRDFHMVCEMAGVDPDALRTTALRRIAGQGTEMKPSRGKTGAVS